MIHSRKSYEVDVTDLELEIHDLLTQYKSSKEDDKKKRFLRLKIVELSLSFVKKIISSPSFKTKNIQDDLFQVGSIGLMKAIDFYDMNKNTKFKTYATYFIKGEIKHYLRDKANFIKPPREIQELSYKISTTSRELFEEGKDGSDIELIAQKLNLPSQKIEDVLALEIGQEILSLDQNVLNDEDDISLMDKIPDGDYKDFLTNSENRLMLNSALEKLPKDLKQILELNYFEDLNQKQISEKLKLSPMQVSRKIKKALNKLYTLIKTEEADNT